MSYDLILNARPDRPCTTEDLRVFLSAWHRGLYRLTESRAIYQNEHTGVSFALDLDAHALAVLRIPLGRAHPFGVEAAREAEGLCRALGLTVRDPQPDGVVGEEYSAAELRRGYERANAWAARSHGSMPDHVVSLDGLPVAVPAPRAAIARAWTWNDAVRERQERRGVTFVADALHGWQDGRLVTFAVWGDAMSILLPQVDLVVLARDVLASQRGRIERAVVPWSELPRGAVTSEDVETPHAEYRHAEPPSELVRWFGALTPTGVPFRPVPFERLIDAEYLRE